MDSRTAGRWAEQQGFDELGRALREVTFCVVDLETTGASVADGAMITEIGAVKVRGGEVLGEFQTLVDPERAISAFITDLTGISDRLVRGAPTIDSALPAFLEFAQGSVLVAHNAPFDIGFLQFFSAAQHRPWPRFEVLDTARLARRVFRDGEVPNCKLSTLAAHVGATTTPTHRALDDARATVDVLHALIARLGGLGVHTLEELQQVSARVSDQQRRKRHLADRLPHAPGVYLFRDEGGRVLYVGTSRDLRRRVRSYFTAAETRTRMGAMIHLAAVVDHVVCATPLEAAVRELRLIGEHKPPYNRRSRFPERRHFVKLTDEPWPRLSLVRRIRDDGATYVGPFARKAQAEAYVAALHDTYPLRQCGDRLALASRRTPCVLAELGRCLSPCDGSVDVGTYAALTRRVRDALHRDPHDVVAELARRMQVASEQTRYEEAAGLRDRLTAFLRGSARSQRVHVLTHCPEIVAARREDDGRWAVHVVRFGRLAAAGVIPPRADALAYVDQLRLSAETVLPGLGQVTGSEETEALLRWLESPGVRLVHVEGEWACPIPGASRDLLDLPAGVGALVSSP